MPQEVKIVLYAFESIIIKDEVKVVACGILVAYGRSVKLLAERTVVTVLCNEFKLLVRISEKSFLLTVLRNMEKPQQLPSPSVLLSECPTARSPL